MIVLLFIMSIGMRLLSFASDLRSVNEQRVFSQMDMSIAFQLKQNGNMLVVREQQLRYLMVWNLKLLICIMLPI